MAEVHRKLTGSSARGECDNLSFLRLDSEVRREAVNALRDKYALTSLNLDNCRTQLIAAEYFCQFDGVSDLKELKARIDGVRAMEQRRDRVVERLIDARVWYEHFFDGHPRWRIDGWSTDLIALASDLYSRSALEIAATVWYDGRVVAKALSPISSVKLPQFEVDHRLLGIGRHVLLSTNLGAHEPFFEVTYPLIGVCGVNSAWMYLAKDDVNRFGAEITEYLIVELPDVAKLIMDLDVPIANRPLGFEGVRFAAECLARHLTITEAAENIADRLIKSSDIDTPPMFSKSEVLNRYIFEVLNVGSLSRPAIFDQSTVKNHASNLAARIVDSFQRREDVYSAWTRYVDYAKLCGVVIRDLSKECHEIKSIWERDFPGTYFSADMLRLSVELLNNHKLIPEVINHLEAKIALSALEPTYARVIRVAGPSSPAIVVN